MKSTVQSQTKESGQVLVLIVVAIVGILGFAALALDGGMLLSERRRAQNAADAGVMAAALAKIRCAPVASRRAIASMIGVSCQLRMA